MGYPAWSAGRSCWNFSSVALGEAKDSVYGHVYNESKTTHIFWRRRLFPRRMLMLGCSGDSLERSANLLWFSVRAGVWSQLIATHRGAPDRLTRRALFDALLGFRSRWSGLGQGWRQDCPSVNYRDHATCTDNIGSLFHQPVGGRMLAANIYGCHGYFMYLCYVQRAALHPPSTRVRLTEICICVTFWLADGVCYLMHSQFKVKAVEMLLCMVIMTNDPAARAFEADIAGLPRDLRVYTLFLA